MVKASRSRVKTLTINRSRDIVADKLFKLCEEGKHAKCTGWAVLKKELSPINANYFLKCICTCHKKGMHVSKMKAGNKKVKKRRHIKRKTRAKKSGKRTKKR